MFSFLKTVIEIYLTLAIVQVVKDELGFFTVALLASLNIFGVDIAQKTYVYKQCIISVARKTKICICVYETPKGLAELLLYRDFAKSLLYRGYAKLPLYRGIVKPLRACKVSRGFARPLSWMSSGMLLIYLSEHSSVFNFLTGSDFVRIIVS